MLVSGGGSSVRRPRLANQCDCSDGFSDLNLPLAGVAFGCVAVFLKMRIPTQSFSEKMARMDWTQVS